MYCKMMNMRDFPKITMKPISLTEMYEHSQHSVNIIINTIPTR